MFGTVVEKIQALLSRSFLLGNFFPVLIFAVLNLATAWFGMDGVSKFILEKWPADAVGISTMLGSLLVALAVLAFVLAPLIPVFRVIMEGEYLPAAILRNRINYYVADANRREKNRDGAVGDFNYFDLTRTRAQDFLGDARNADGPRDRTDRAAFEAAQLAYRDLDAEITRCRASQPVPRNEQGETYSSQLPRKALVKVAIRKLAIALRQYPMQAEPTNPNPEIYRELSRLQIQLLDRLDNAKDDADRALKRAEAEFRRRFLSGTTHPTRLGIERAAIERYPQIAYKADFDFIWPRLRMALPKDAAVTSAVDTASAQLDFAVLATALSVLTTAIWWPVLALGGSSYAAYVTVGLLGPAIIALFYRLTLETQQAFGEVMVTAVDTLRLQLLVALRQPLPASLSAEQKTWEQLQGSLYSGLGDPIRYRHPKQ